MTTHQEEWISHLVAFAAHKHAEEPVPARSALTSEEEFQCRVLGGHLISWLEKWGPKLLQERNVLADMRGWDKDPHVVFLTAGPGLSAASEILEGAESQVTWLTAQQFADFQTSHPDNNQTHHCLLESWFLKAPVEEEETLRAKYETGSAGTLWMHHDHTVMGPQFTRGGWHLWLGQDGQMKMLEEGFRSWLT